VVIHEVAHGLAARKLGDRTAEHEGRLTLNPIPHIDPFGSIILPLLLMVTGSPFLVGWASQCLTIPTISVTKRGFVDGEKPSWQ
jgi:Zn-dependent protease